MRLGISFNFLKESLEKKNAIESYYDSKFAIFLRRQAVQKSVTKTLYELLRTSLRVPDGSYEPQ